MKECLDEVLELNKDHGFALELLAKCAVLTGDLKKAIKIKERTIAATRTSDIARLSQMLKDCACFYFLNGERNKCIQYYDEGVKIQTKIWGEVDQLPSIGTLEDLRNGVEVEVGFDADGVEWAFKRRFDP
mmetsp:Transcript_31794/g.71301  ORF Transcript_31794/g.71301 Transcript_31794/m.71301 type:complete len:130 (+) Transcript_31794:121-510(+)